VKTTPQNITKSKNDRMKMEWYPLSWCGRVAKKSGVGTLPVLEVEDVEQP
jgi:hypothetical protein